MRILLLTCFFFSGITSLLFEIVWTRWFTVLFGSTTTSASVVLAATFLGVAVGNRVFGRIADRSSNPAMLYGRLELGVAGGVLFVYLILFAKPPVENVNPTSRRSLLVQPAQPSLPLHQESLPAPR